jgi:hypothetical protein
MLGLAAVILCTVGCTDDDDETVVEQAIETATLIEGEHIAETSFGVPQESTRDAATMYVRLAAAPDANAVVSVDWASGDPDQAIYVGPPTIYSATSDLTFTAENYNEWQEVFFVTSPDSDGVFADADYALSIDGDATVDTVTVNSYPETDALASFSGTIDRTAFELARAVTDPADDIRFTLKWKRVGTGTTAQYYGVYSDDDTLNQAAGDAHNGDAVGNEARDAFEYPAYGFWDDGTLTFVVSKTIATDRSTAEQNLVILRSSDESYASGTGYVTGTDVNRATGSYSVSFTATADAVPASFDFPTVDAEASYDIEAAPMQLSAYLGGGGVSNLGQWSLTRTESSSFFFTGSSTDAEGNSNGTDLGGVLAASIEYDAEGSPIVNPDKPNLIGIQQTDDGITVFGLDFRKEVDPSSTSFPFGYLGGRSVDLANGTSNRLYWFLSFLAGPATVSTNN